MSEKPITQFTDGRVRAVQVLSPRRGKVTWHLRYTDPDTGRDVKRRVSGNEAAARAEAKALNLLAYSGRGHLASQKRAPLLDDGIADAIKLSRGNAQSRDDMALQAERFAEFMAERYPAVKTWDTLKPSMAEAYLRHLEGAGLAWDTIRLRLVPLRLAWKLMHADYPGLVAAPPALRLPPKPRREIQCLDAAELALLLDWMRGHCPALYPMACLQGLAGLRMLEAAALRRQDVDLEVGTVTVAKTEHHTPKTRDSYRAVPVSGEVLAALKAAVAGQKVRPASGELFLNQDGELWQRKALGHRWAYTLKRAAEALWPEQPRKKTGRPKRQPGQPPEGGQPKPADPPKLSEAEARAKERLRSIPPRKLRAAFATLAGQLGAPDRLLKAYLGHTPGDILGGHYRRVDPEELRSVSRLMDGWRKAAEAEASRKQSGNNSAAESASA